MCLVLLFVILYAVLFFIFVTLPSLLFVLNFLILGISCRVAAAARFQRAFLKLLRDAQFEELSAQDLLLTSALNTDYILTLPIYVDWKKASESNAIIFR